MMRRIAATAFAIACAITISAVALGHRARAQGSSTGTYFPYPPGLIPADLPYQSTRVMGEIDKLEQEAMAQWQALPLNTGTAMRQQQLLGKIELYDKNLSVNRNLACSFCHMPYTGFTGPISSVNNTTVAYPGSVH